MIKKFLSSQLRVNMASGVVTTVIKTVTLVAAYPIYLHFLGFEKYGLWLVLATVLNIARLGNLGIDQAVMKLVAEEYGRGNIEGIQRYVTTALSLLCLSGTVVLIVVLVLKTQIIAAFKLTGENAGMVSWLLPYIGCLSIYVFLVEVLNAILSGIGRIDLANYIQALGRIMAVAITSLLLYRGQGIESLLIGNTLSCVFVHIVSLICVWRIVHIRLLRIGNLDIECCKRILHFGGGVFGGTLISMLHHPFNKLMLSRYAGISIIPVYQIVVHSTFQMKTLLEQGLRAIIPEISRLSGLATRYAVDRIKTINYKAMKLILFGALPIYAVLFITTKSLLKIWLRDQYTDAIPPAFRIMLVCSYLSLVGVPAFYAVMGIGKVRYCFITNAIVTLGNFVVVFAILFLTGYVSVTGISLGLIPIYSVATLYIILKARRVSKYLQREYLPISNQGKDGLWKNTRITTEVKLVERK